MLPGRESDPLFNPTNLLEKEIHVFFGGLFQGRHEVVSLLLDRKANVEHRAKTGLTPLMEAASGGYVDVGRVLLDKGADVNAPPVPSSRDTALTIAADKGHYRFVELLLSRGAQVLEPHGPHEIKGIS